MSPSLLYTHAPRTTYHSPFIPHPLNYACTIYRYFPYAQLDNVTGLPLANMANPDEGFADDDNDDKAPVKSATVEV